MASLYAMRDTARQLIHLTLGCMAVSLRCAWRACRTAQEQISKRNAEVALEQARQNEERAVVREFMRIEQLVTGDLSAHPAIRRRLAEELERSEADRKAASDAPPDPPAAWVKLLAQMASVAPHDRSGVIGALLAQSQHVLDRMMASYSSLVRTRHKTLEGLKRRWAAIQRHIKAVDRGIEHLGRRVAEADTRMERLESILAAPDRATHLLRDSVFRTFVVSAVFTFIAVGGAAVNFTMIARPMGEMVGGHEYVGPYELKNIAALVIIFVELSMGTFVMESLRITNLFPVIGDLSDANRRRILTGSLFILTVMACGEAGLAFMRDTLMLDDLKTSAALRGDPVLAPAHAGLSTATQMGLGFILPFALMVAAIPFETLIHSMRGIGGKAAVAVVALFGLVLYMLSGVFRRLEQLALAAYDAPIFVPLLIERAVAGQQPMRKVPPRHTTQCTSVAPGPAAPAVPEEPDDMADAA